MAANDFTQAGGGPGGGPGLVYITFSSPGQRDFGARLGAWSAAMEDMTEAWTQVGEQILLRDFGRQMAQEGGWLGPQIGPPWQQLRPSTQRDRLRKGYPPDHPILVRTAELLHSVTQRGAAGNVFIVTPRSLSVGTTNQKARWHQFGTSRMPARKMIGLRYASRMEITRLMFNWVQEKARESGIAMYGEGWAAP